MSKTLEVEYCNGCEYLGPYDWKYYCCYETMISEYEIFNDIELGSASGCPKQLKPDWCPLPDKEETR